MKMTKKNNTTSEYSLFVQLERISSFPFCIVPWICAFFLYGTHYTHRQFYYWYPFVREPVARRYRGA